MTARATLEFGSLLPIRGVSSGRAPQFSRLPLNGCPKILSASRQTLSKLLIRIAAYAADQIGCSESVSHELFALK